MFVVCLNRLLDVWVWQVLVCWEAPRHHAVQLCQGKIPEKDHPCSEGQKGQSERLLCYWSKQSRGLCTLVREAPTITSNLFTHLVKAAHSFRVLSWKSLGWAAGTVSHMCNISRDLFLCDFSCWPWSAISVDQDTLVLWSQSAQSWWLLGRLHLCWKHWHQVLLWCSFNCRGTRIS